MDAYRLYNSVTESIPHIMFSIMGICGIVQSPHLFKTSDFSKTRVERIETIETIDRIKILENQAQYHLDRSVQLRIAGEDTRADNSFSQANRYYTTLEKINLNKN